MATLKSSFYKSHCSNTLQWLKQFSGSFHSCNVNNIYNPEEPSQPKPKSLHEYSRLWKFSSVEATSKYLLENVFYHKDGVLALNKPAGLSSSKTEDSIYNCLPYLAKEFDYKYLQLVHVPDKYYSGVTLLSSDAKITDKLENSIRRSKSIYSKDPKQTFLAITVGHPINDQNNNQYGVTKRRKDKTAYPFILHEWGTNEVKRREVNVGHISHRVLAKSEFASLVSVSTWQLRLHCPRLYLSDIMLSPVLGDNIFGPRVTSVFDKPLLVKPWFAPAVKALPLSLLSTLRVQSGSEALIPLHFHLHELVLHKFLSTDSDLVLQTQPPSYFQWTQKQLNLEVLDETRQSAAEEDIDSNAQESNKNINC